MRTVKLLFGILEGLRFDIVNGLYAIALNFMEVMQDLISVQLEHQEAKTQGLAILYSKPTQLMMLSDHDSDTNESLDSTSTIGPAYPRPPAFTGITLQMMLRNPDFYAHDQIEAQRAYEVLQYKDTVCEGGALLDSDTFEPYVPPHRINKQLALVPVLISGMNYSHLHIGQVVQPTLIQQEAVAGSTNLDDEDISDMPELRDDIDDDEPHGPSIPNTTWSTVLSENRSRQQARSELSALSTRMSVNSPNPSWSVTI